MPTHALYTYPAAVLLLFACFLPARSAEPRHPYPVQKKIYRQPDGLPGKNITCGVEDENGFLWFGTKNGLCRFDGKTFLVLSEKSHGLFGNNIIDLACSGDHLVVTYGRPGSTRKPLRYRQVINIHSREADSLQQVWPQMPFAQERIGYVFNTAEGELGFVVREPNEIWLLSAGRFVQKFAGNQTLAEHPFAQSDFVKVFMDKNRCYIKSDLGKIYLRGNEKGFRFSNGDYAGALVNDTAVFLWHKQLPAGKFYRLSLKDSVPVSVPRLSRIAQKQPDNIQYYITHGNATTLAHCADGSVWMYGLSDEFILLFGNGEPGFPKNIRVNYYFKDSRGIFWLCTSEGLIKLRLEENRFRTHYTRESSGLELSSSARGIYANGDTLCINTYNYFILKIGEKETIIKKWHEYALLPDKNGFWLGTFEVSRYDHATGKITTQTDTRGAEIWGMCPLDNRKILLCTTNGFDVFDPVSKEITSLSYGPFPRAQFGYRCFKNDRGQFIAVAENGVYVLSGTGKPVDFYGREAKQPGKKLPCRSVHDVFRDREGNYWIASDAEGLYTWNRDLHKFERFGVEQGFISNTVYCIREDDFGCLWLSTDYGLVRFNKHTRAAKTYTMADGIADNEFNRTSQFKDADGRIYFGGVNGVTSFDPADFSRDTRVKNIPFRITEMAWYNEKSGRLEALNTQTVQTNGLEMPPEIKFFTLSFSLLDFEDRPHRYAYRIEGIDRDWIYTDENTLRYGHLPYGNFTLRIKAQTANGYWNAREITIPLRVRMPFYKTWWFMGLAALAFAGAVLLIAFLVFRQRLKHIHALSNLRLKLASDLHDEVGGLLNKTAMQSELAHSKANDTTRELLEKIADNCRKAMSGIRDIMWNIDPRNDNSTDLADRLKEYAMDMLGDRFDYSVQVEEREKKQLHPEVKQAVYLIGKEAINNIVKHASTGPVEIKLEIKSDRIRLSVGNEGLFSPKETSTGQGLRNMQMRARKLEGTFHIDTSHGVCIAVEIPLKSHVHAT